MLYSRTFAVREGDHLDVDLGSERVEILPARGREATVTVRGEGRDAEAEFQRRRFSADYSNGRLDVRTDPPRSFRMGSTDARFVVTVEVPVQFSATVDVGSGSVRVERLNGDLNVSTGSGSIEVGTARGRRVALDTGSGSVRADVLAGEVEIDTGSGSIQVGRVTGSFAGDTGSGSIRVAEADVDRFFADTGSGSVSARLLREADVEVDTGSGHVEITLPRAAGADVELSGGPVRIDDALGFRGEKERDYARGRIGNGGRRVHVDTGSGGVSLLAR